MVTKEAICATAPIDFYSQEAIVTVVPEMEKSFATNKPVTKYYGRYIEIEPFATDFRQLLYKTNTVLKNDSI